MKTSRFIQLEEELDAFRSIMARASDAVIDQKVSKYPIFVVHQEQINAGIVLVDKEQSGGKWSIHISTLEEFVNKKLIEEKKVDSFRTIYKDQKKYLCLFVLSELGAKFVFLTKERKKI